MKYNTRPIWLHWQNVSMVGLRHRSTSLGLLVLSDRSWCLRFSSHSNGQNRPPDWQHELHLSHSAVCPHCWRPWVDQTAQTDGLQGGFLARPELAGDAQCRYRVPPLARQGSLWLVYSLPGRNTVVLHWIIMSCGGKVKVIPASFFHRLAVLCWSWVRKLWKQFHGSHWCSCLLHVRALFMCAEYTDQDAGEADRTQYISARHVQEKVSRIIPMICLWRSAVIPVSFRCRNLNDDIIVSPGLIKVTANIVFGYAT